MRQSQENSQKGFTLVELAIVLVIIGLIVGGVLVGQDMIKAAEVRATVGQYEKYNAALNTFRTRFNAMPGDITGAATGQAASFGMTSRTGAAGHGDGDGLLESCSDGTILAGCETVLFWSDLSFANLIDGNFSTATDALAASLAAASIPSYFPAGKVGRGNYFHVYAVSGLNYYQLAGINCTGAAGVFTACLSTNLTPSEAFNMDNKVDDGAPGTGIVQAMSSTGTMNTAAADAGACRISSTAYQTDTAAEAATPACQLRFRFN